MNAAVAAAIAFAVYVAGYLIYSRYLSERVFELREEVDTPAHAMRDGVDYVPSQKGVLFGHHYASIAGLAPMLGPAVAVIWGWLPAMAWVVLGALFIGCVHDFGSLVLSIRAKGKSIGEVAEGVVGPRAKTLFHIIIFFLIALAMGVFVSVLGDLLSASAGSVEGYPEAIVPTAGLMVAAVAMGVLGYKFDVSWKWLTPIGFVLVLALTYVGALDSVGAAMTDLDPGMQAWIWLLLGYALIACVIPVWTLLQPRDFLNCLLLFLGLGAVYLGLFVEQPEFVAPAVDMDPEGAPGMFPFVFIIIACGAASGFHSLVASGTTAKQLDNEMDARPIGYGGMIGESLLGLLAVLATTAGIVAVGEWEDAYPDWHSIQGVGVGVEYFVDGCAHFLSSIGVDTGLGTTFISLIVVSYALTTLDSGTRLLRYNIEEMADTAGLNFAKNRYVSTLLAVGVIGYFAFYEIDGKPAGLVLWELFGTTNQLLAGLALLAITLYLIVRKKPWYVAGLPMILVLGTTITAMTIKIEAFVGDKNWLLATIGSILLILAVWLLVEAVLAIRRLLKSDGFVDSLDIDL